MIQTGTENFRKGFSDFESFSDSDGRRGSCREERRDTFVRLSVWLRDNGQKNCLKRRINFEKLTSALSIKFSWGRCSTTGGRKFNLLQRHA